MARLHPSNVKEIASNKPASGATAFTLPDSATAPYRSFDTALADGDTVPVHATNGSAWQDFIGTFTAGAPDSLAQTTLLDSSTGAFIDWSLGGDVTLEVAWVGKMGERFDNPGVVIVSSDATTTQSFAAATLVKVTTALATEIIDGNGWWDHVNSKFVPTIAGKFLITCSAQLDAVAASKIVQVTIQKNAADYAYGPACEGRSGFLTTLVTAAAGDAFEMYLYNGDTVARSTLAGVGRVFFHATLIEDNV